MKVHYTYLSYFNKEIRAAIKKLKQEGLRLSKRCNSKIIPSQSIIPKYTLEKIYNEFLMEMLFYIITG